MKKFIRMLALLVCITFGTAMLPQTSFLPDAYATSGTELPETQPESKTAPETSQQPDPTATTEAQQPAASPDAEPTPAASATAAPQATESAAPEAGATVTPEATATVVPDATATTAPEGDPTQQPTPEIDPTAVPESTPDGTLFPEPTLVATAEPTTEPTVEPTATVVPEPVIVTPAISHTSATIGRGDSGLVLSVRYSDGQTTEADGTPRNVTFASSKSSVAKVDASGRVTGGKTRGTAVITAYTPYGNVSCKVKVVYAPKKVSVDITATELMIGQTAQLAAEYPSGYGGTFEYKTTNENVAKVDASGKVTAAGKGTAIVGVQTFNGKTAKKTVTVYAPVSSLDIAAESLLSSEQMRAQLKLVIPEYERGTFSYASSNPEIASIDASGMVQTHRVGTTQITVTSDSGISVTRELKVEPMPTSVSFTASSINIGIDETVDLTQYVRVNDGSAAEYSFKTSNKKYVGVNSEGKITGERKGKAVITVETHNGLTASITVNVLKKPSKVSASPSAMTLGVGQEGRVSASFSSGYYGGVSYASSDESVATVSANGTIKAVGAGSAKITLTTYNGKTAACTLTVLSAPETISAAEPEMTLGLGESGRKVKGVSPKGTMCSYTYASSNPAVVSVDSASGALTAHAKGEAVITITSSNGKQATASVKVLNAPTQLTLSATQLTIAVGESNESLKAIVDEGAASGLTFKSSSTKYVKIVDGAIYGVKAGTATITATTYNGLTATCKVTVGRAPSKVSFGSETYTLGAGMETKLSVEFNSNKAYSLCSYESSDANIAYVDPNTGLVRGVSAGTAKIRVTTSNGKKDTCTINVLSAPETISAAEPEMTLGLGESGRRVKGVSPDGTMCSYTYVSSNPAVVSVDSASGALTAHVKGEAVITITSSNGKQATASVKVLNAPTQMSLSATQLTIAVGESNESLKAIVDEGAASGLSFKSSKTKYVKIVDGAIYGVKAGTATITATTYNGLTATCKVTVAKAPSKVSFSSDDYEIGLGMDAWLAVEFNSSSAYSLCSYLSSDTSVVTVNPNTGVITGVGVGTAKIQVTTLNNKKDTCTVTVHPAPESLVFASDPLKLPLGITTPVKTQILPEQVGSLSYTSSDNAIASVSADGKITAHALGSAIITATSYNGVSNSFTVEVVPAPVAISFAAPKVSIVKGDIIELPKLVVVAADGSETVCLYTYKSSNTKVAQVNSEGLAKGVKNGTVTITATTYNGLEASFKLYVSGSITGVTLSTNAATLLTDGKAFHETLQLTAMVEGVSAGSIEFASSDPAVASVDINGLVTAVAPGTASISATSFNGIRARCTITVMPISSTISLGEAREAVIGVGEALQLAPVFEANTSAKVSYSTSDEAIAAVNSNGRVTGKAEGTVTLTAAMQNGVSDSITLKVLPAPTAISMQRSGMIMEINAQEKLACQLSANAGTYRDVLIFSSSNPAVATVSAGGTITAVSSGKAVITAETCNGLKASCDVLVKSAGEEIEAAFGREIYNIEAGTGTQLSVLLSSAASTNAYTIVSSDPAIASVEGTALTAHAAGTVTLVLTVNQPTAPEIPQQPADPTLPSEPSVPAEPSQPSAGEGVLPANASGTTAPVTAVCIVNVVEAAEITLSAESITMYTDAQETLTAALNPAELVGGMQVSVDSDVISYDPASGTITSADQAGTAVITFWTQNSVKTCTVNVHGPIYRSLIIAEFNNSGYSNDLKFANNNADGIAAALGNSSVNGEEYAIKKVANNPSKSEIKRLLTTTFADATDRDVSVIYIVAHGHQNVGNTDGYGFSLPGYSKSKPSTYVTADELYSWIEGIKGHVVLTLCTCRSGGFIDQMEEQLEAKGNISVVCSSHYSTVSSYYTSDVPSENIDYFTQALLEGIGYDEVNKEFFKKMYADTNGDGNVTLGELFSYTAERMRENVFEQAGLSEFAGNISQAVQYFLNSVAKNLILSSWNK